MCWHICGLYVCVCTQSHHNNSSGNCLISLHHHCNVLFFSSSADCLKRDSHEVIHSSLDAITWLVAKQLLYTVTHPSWNNVHWKKEKLPFSYSHMWSLLLINTVSIYKHSFIWGHFYAPFILKYLSRCVFLQVRLIVQSISYFRQKNPFQSLPPEGLLHNS